MFRNLTYLLGVRNCSSNIFIPVLFPFTLALLRMKNAITPLCCAAFIVDCFMSVRIHSLLNLSSFTQGHKPLCISIPTSLKHKHVFHYDFWHDPKCDRNSVIQVWLMQILPTARNLAILYTKSSRDFIKSMMEVWNTFKYQFQFIAMRFWKVQSQIFAFKNIVFLQKFGC